MVHHRFLFCGAEHYDGVDWNTQVERLRRRLGRERESGSSERDILENRETLKWDRERFCSQLSPKPFIKTSLQRRWIHVNLGDMDDRWGPNNGLRPTQKVRTGVGQGDQTLLGYRA